MAAREILSLVEDSPSSGEGVIRAPTTGDTYSAPRKVAIAPEVNTNALAVTGYSLTGSNASSLVDLAGTWNTTGAPTAIKADITNTASGAAALLLDLQVGSGSRHRVTKDGVIRGATNSGANPYAVPLASWMRLAADYTLTSTTNSQKLFDTTANGRFTLPTGFYEIEAFLYIDSMSATSGNAKIDLLGAGTATTEAWAWSISGTDASSPLGANTKSGAAPVSQATGAACMAATTGTALVASLSGVFRITAAGTVIPSLELLTAAAAVVKANSYIIFRKIGESTENYVGACD